MKQILRYVFCVLLLLSGLMAQAANTNASKVVARVASGESELINNALAGNAKKAKPVNAHKSSRALAISLTKTDETCPKNGTINATVTGADVDAVLTYEYYSDAAPNNVITTTMPISGLGADTYHIKVISTTTVVQEASASITLVKTYVPINASSTVVNNICAGDLTGKITLNIKAGASANKFVLVSAPATYIANALPFQQSSNVFANLPTGIYQIQYYDACGLYNTITVTLNTQTSYNRYYSYYRVDQTDCSKFTIDHHFYSDNGGNIKYPYTVLTEVRDKYGNPIASQSDVVTGVTQQGVTQSYLQHMTFTNPAFEYPIWTNTTITDACGKIFHEDNRVKTNQIYLKGLCPPLAGFNWNINNIDIMPADERNPNATWPLTISWVNAADATDNGSVTTAAGTTPWADDISGLTPNATFNVTITDACGHIRTATTTTGLPTNAGQKAWVKVIPACETGSWIPYLGTDPSATNRKIDNFKVIAAPAGFPYLGQLIGGSPIRWAFSWGMFPEGHYVFEIYMGCETDVVTVDAVGGGVKMLNPVMTPTTTCNTSNVTINYTWLQGGANIPVPVLIAEEDDGGNVGYTTGYFAYALKDINLTAGAQNPFDYQAGTTFTNVPNGTYNVLMNTPRTLGTDCTDLVIGQIIVNNTGP